MPERQFDAGPTPVNPGSRGVAAARRIAVLGAALGVHAGAALLVLQPVGPEARAPAAPATPVDVVLVTVASAPPSEAPAEFPAEPASETAPELEPGAASSVSGSVSPMLEPEAPASDERRSQPLAEALSAETSAEPSPPAAPAPAGINVLAAPGGQGAPTVVFQPEGRQGGSLRSVVCAGAGAAMRAALACETAAIDLTAHARSDSVEVVDAHFARANAPPSREVWLMLGLQPRRGSLMAAPDPRFSASDSMRDRLPPSAPDPAFGD